MTVATVLCPSTPLRAADIDVRTTFLRTPPQTAPAPGLPLGSTVAASASVFAALDRRARHIILYAAITTFLGVLDLVLTLAVARTCGTEFEVNPIARYFLELGPLYVGAFKGLSVAANIAITWAYRHRPSALFCARASALIMLALTVHWSAALYQVHQSGMLMVVLNP